MTARVIYESKNICGTNALAYIDRGIMSGYKQAGTKVVSWDGRNNQPDLVELLQSFRPTHFLPNLQSSNWQNPNSWCTGRIWKALSEYKSKNGLFVGARSGPSNIQDLFSNVEIDFSQFPGKGVSNFYQQPERPTKLEKEILESGFIDIIRSSQSREIYEVAFRNFLDLGISILEEPHAACTETYFRFLPDLFKGNDIVYVGGAWPFKLSNMEPYVKTLKEEFGSRFKLYGKDWPLQYKVSPLSGRFFNLVVQRAAICIALHEPTQVLSFPFATNERPFKLMAMGCCVVSDSNPWLKRLFDVPEEMIVAANPTEMRDWVAELLLDKVKRKKIARAGRKKVLQSHTYAVRAKRLLEVASWGSLPSIIPYR